MSPAITILLVFVKYCIFLCAAGGAYGVVFEKQRNFANILRLIVLSVVWLLFELYTIGVKLPFLP